MSTKIFCRLLGWHLFRWLYTKISKFPLLVHRNQPTIWARPKFFRKYFWQSKNQLQQQWLQTATMMFIEWKGVWWDTQREFQLWAKDELRQQRDLMMRLWSETTHCQPQHYHWEEECYFSVHRPFLGLFVLISSSKKILNIIKTNFIHSGIN